MQFTLPIMDAQGFDTFRDLLCRRASFIRVRGFETIAQGNGFWFAPRNRDGMRWLRRRV